MTRTARTKGLVGPQAQIPPVLAALAVWLIAAWIGCFPLVGPVCAADPTFPALSGRVVDNAGLLDAAARQRLDTKLAALEEKSGIQLVVATISTLDGQEIEPYANSLFRFWKLGEAKNNNGILLLVAPKEHKVRIEVGYGEEGTLTDALSKVIITNAIVPRFKTGDFGGGIERGVDDTITVLTTDSSEWQKRPSLRQDGNDSSDVLGDGAAATVLCHRDFHHHPLGSTLAREPNGRQPMDHSALRRWLGWRRLGRWIGWLLRRWGQLFRWRRIVGGRRRLGQLVMRISSADRARVLEAIRAAEQQTSGEFVCVWMRSASRYPFYALAWAALVALVEPWLLLATQWTVLSILTAQLGTFALVALVLSAPGIRGRLVPRRVQRAAAHRAAAEQFLIRGLASAPHRCGILLFVAQEERYIRIIADDGAAARIQEGEWRKAVDLLRDGARQGRHAEGYVGALAHCGRLMGDVFPADAGSVRTLPDRFYVIEP